MRTTKGLAPRFKGKKRKKGKKASVKYAVIGSDGVKRWVDTEGNTVPAPKDIENNFGIEFDKEVAVSIVTQMAQGRSLKESLRYGGIRMSDYMQWRRVNPGFGAAVNKARELRSELLHDRVFDKDIASMQESRDLESLTADELDVEMTREKVRMQRQKTLTEFMRKDAPGRFGQKPMDTGGQLGVSLNIGVNIPKDVQAMINKCFRPDISPEGELEVIGFETDGKEVQGVEVIGGEDSPDKEGQGGHGASGHKEGV